MRFFPGGQAKGPLGLLPGNPFAGEPPVPRFLLVETEPELELEPELEPEPVTPVQRPGCTAADETLTVLGHLNGLAEGWGGFGVLKTSVQRLDRAAQGARMMGDMETETAILEFAEMLSGVSTPEEASAAAEALEPIVQRAWALGKRCGAKSQALALLNH